MARTRALLTIVLTLGIAVLGAAAPASAAPHFASAPKVQIGHTDSKKPWTAHDWTEQVDMPMGAWLDDAGEKHVSRVYVTFDLSQFAGTKVTGGTIWIQERRVTDCSKRAIEVWQTRTLRRTPSWRTAPRELRKLDEVLTIQSCPAQVSFDVSAAVTEALSQNKQRVTFALRVPEQFETDLSYGRHLSWYNSVTLTVRYNTVPHLDEQSLTHGGFVCREGESVRALGGFAGYLQALGIDADDRDGLQLRYDFAVWPVDDPAARTELSQSGGSGRYATVQVPAELQEDGRTYAWQARVSDGLDTSSWSRTCQYLVDRTPPSAPAVNSSNYPRDDSGEWAPVGEPGRFTLSGGGDTAVLGFEYAWNQSSSQGCEGGGSGQIVCKDPFTLPGTVRADAPGGTAMLEINPRNGGLNILHVRSIDRAGNRSGGVEYGFLAPHARPVVSVVGTPPAWGEQVTLKFSPPEGVTGTTAYTYRLDTGETQTVSAAADGTATVSFQATSEHGHQMTVQSYSGNGWVSLSTPWSVTFDPWPGVTSDIYRGWEPVGGVGVQGSFTFSPPPGQAWTQITGYRYTFDGEDPVFVPAGPDRRATITWAPQASGYTALSVVALAADGTESYDAYYDFNVA
jgi:hypothetical protein